MKKIKDFITSLETLAPLATAEDFDNVGLLVGNPETQVTGVLVTLDTLENVVQEAIDKNCNLIVSFHPIIFSGLKSLTGKTYVERTVMKAIANNIAIYAIHTALDNAFNGVNAGICKRLGLKDAKILLPQKKSLQKLTTYVPDGYAAKIREALFLAGAGTLTEKYSQCSFNIQGKGTFFPEENSQPFVGEKGSLHTENETQISVVFPRFLQQKVLKNLHDAHPYQEVAYEISTLDNKHPNIGLGMIGTLSEPLQEADFIQFLKEKMHTPCVRYSNFLGKAISRVAVLGGSGAFAIEAAIGAGADAYVSSDFKYHDFYRAENQILLADIGHYESEQFTKELLVAFLSEKFPTFAIILSNVNTNPINYA